MLEFLKSTGFYLISQTPEQLIMIAVACLLLYLAIVKKFEPLLLLPIAFGMLLTNLPGAEMYHEQIFANGHVDWAFLGDPKQCGLLDYLYLGVKLGIYPCLIFMGVGAMTDFGPLIANPKGLIFGAAAQLGIYIAFILALAMGNSAWFTNTLGIDFTANAAASIGIIGGADGPTAILVTSKLAPELLGPIAVAAYSYMALVPVIQPPIMKALTTKEERMIDDGTISVKSLRVDTNTLLYQVPGGMLSNLISQLKQANAEDKYYDVLAEIPRVREDFGYPPLVTPTSQIVGTQAVLNVLSGERYKTFTKESKGVLRGEYGRLPGKVNEAVRRKAIGDAEVITCRPADLLKPELETYREEIKDHIRQEEDVLSYALFPQVAMKFFEAREAAEKKANEPEDAVRTLYVEDLSI